VFPYEIRHLEKDEVVGRGASGGAVGHPVAHDARVVGAVRFVLVRVPQNPLWVVPENVRAALVVPCFAARLQCEVYEP